jgi:hypothetical protein
MAGFEAWNQGIAAYFIAGAAKGSPIFLSLDGEAIEDIAARFLEESVEGGAQRDFMRSIRRRCISDGGDYVDIEALGRTIGTVPGGVAFLGLMVLAAYKMQEEEGIDETNYFLRLREVLGLPQIQRRPEGMTPPGAEEPLWKEWNNYLVAMGFQPTAERGAGPQTYLRYVLSQAILRESDKQFLEQRFREAHLGLQLDCDQLGFWLSRQNFNRRHLSEGLHHTDPARIWEFYRSAHRLYETGAWVDGAHNRSSSERGRQRSIECGVYRTVDLVGDAEYWLLPKEPPRTRSLQLKVIPTTGGSPQPLLPLCAGFFEPMWPVNPFEDRALEFEVIGDPMIQKLLFPRRDFWILVRDPENPQGAWGTWKPYLELGEPLLVLCRRGPLSTEMERFREAKLLDWATKMESGSAIEYHGCMVLSYDWGGFIPSVEARPLADALTPRSMAGISLVGGLRDPNQNAWLEGYPPAVKIYGFDRQFEIELTSSRGYAERREVPRQELVALGPDLEPDAYQVDVRWNGKRAAARMFRIVAWSNIQEHLEPEIIVNTQASATGGLALRGPRIVRGDLERSEVSSA